MSRIYHDISRLDILIRHRLSHTLKCLGIPWGTDSKMCIDLMYKSGTVNPIGQTVSSPYIRISDKLLRKSHNICAAHICCL